MSGESEYGQVRQRLLQLQRELRALLDTGEERHTGFSAAGYQNIFSHHTL
jgi:hypothetical protein